MLEEKSTNCEFLVAGISSEPFYEPEASLVWYASYWPGIATAESIMILWVELQSFHRCIPIHTVKYLKLVKSLSSGYIVYILNISNFVAVLDTWICMVHTATWSRSFHAISKYSLISYTCNVRNSKFKTHLDILVKNVKYHPSISHIIDIACRHYVALLYALSHSTWHYRLKVPY